MMNYEFNEYKITTMNIDFNGKNSPMPNYWNLWNALDEGRVNLARIKNC